MGHLSQVLLVIAILVAISQGAEDLGTCLPSRTFEKCKDGFAPAFEDKYQDGDISPYCCTANSKTLDDNKKEFRKCRVTNCMKPNENMCSTLPVRYIDGEKLLHDDEILREDGCLIDNVEPGSEALCCGSDTMDSTLSTAVCAEPNEFPHQARLPGCGGTIYNEKYIITAAHCVVDENNGRVWNHQFKIHVGTNIGETKKAGIVVEKVIVHHNYSQLHNNPAFRKDKSQREYFNDVAILKLSKSLDLKNPDNKVKALELAPKGFQPFLYSDRAAIIGWGKTVTGRGKPFLAKTNLILRSDEVCFAPSNGRRKYGRFADQLLCVGGNMTNSYSMTVGRGDSGGPAICRNKQGHPVHCGISSFAGDETKPSVFAEVSHFHEWIKEKTNTVGQEQDEETLYRPYLYGRDVAKKEFEHQVYITSNTAKTCGGTLVAPNLVITAAQCVASKPGRVFDGVKVIPKTIDLKKQKEGISVENVFIPEGFKRVAAPTTETEKILAIDTTYESDYAVLKLSEDVVISKYPQLPDKKDTFPKGKDLSYPLGTSGTLRSRKMKLLSPLECQKRMIRLDRKNKARSTLKEDLICGVEEYSGGSTCDRTLGGGLICQGTGRTDVLCGVHSQRLCLLSVPYGYVNMADPDTLVYVKQVIETYGTST